jgi:protein BUR2
VAQKNARLIIDEQSKEYWRWRDSILAYEEVMLETLTFDLMVEHPYHRLYDQLVQLNLHHDKKVRDAAWTFCNDSCLTILPLLMEAREIAVSAIFFASASTDTKINDVNGRPWWEAVGGNAEKMTKAATILADFIKENPLQKKQQPLGPGSPVFNLESTRRTGEGIEPIVYSQTDDGNASQNGTPMVATGSEDRAAVSQSPNKAAGSDSQADITQTVAGDISQQPGDSDAGLKAAANDLDVHQGVSNGRGVRSPDGKRRALAEDINAEDEGRASKRARTDEGGKDDEYTARD